MTRIGWEAFARARAKLDAGLDREATLAEAGVDAETWAREQEALLAELAGDVERADFTRLEAYRAAYHATWAELTDLDTADAPRVGERAIGQTPVSAFPAPLPPIEIQQASFQRAAPVAPWSPARPGPSLVASVPDDHPVDATLAPAGLVIMDPLPFQPVASPRVATRPQDDPTRPIPPPLTPEPPSPSSSRSGATIHPPLTPASPVLPFQAPSAAPRLTLEQYASLCAELAVFPQHVETIFSKYGLVSLRERLTVDLAWQERLRRDPTEYAAWQGLYHRYQTYWVDTAHHD
jgi:hypothetical protein